MHLGRPRWLLAPLLALLASCAIAERAPEEFRPASDPELETIVVLGTNDMHGALAPQINRTREAPNVEPVEYERGGAAAFSGQLRILRDKFGDRLLWLDAGDQFQGSLESNIEEGAGMLGWLNAVRPDAAAIGNHEFDFGPEGRDRSGGDPLGALKARLAEAKYPFLAANIIDRRTGKAPTWPNLAPSTVLSAGRVKVGVIGLITSEAATATRPEYVRGLAFESMTASTLREATRLRKQGAQVIIALAHAGTRCEVAPAPAEHSLRRPTDPQGPCDANDELSRWLSELPPGTVDAVVSGHRHTLLHHWINGVPVIQGGTRNHFFNLIYLTFDRRTGKLATDRTRIEGPIPICPRVFENQRDCLGDRPPPRKGRGPLVRATLHGRPVETPPAVAAILEPVFAKVDQAKRRVIAQAERPLKHDRPCTGEMELGNLVADAMRVAAKSDVALLNCGMIRTGFEPGPVTYGDLFRSIPFDNEIVSLSVTGKQLKLLLRVAQSGALGFFPTSGLSLKVLDPSLPAPTSDLDGNGRIQAWEIDRLVDARLADGSPIEDSKVYRLVTVDFLVAGGDDMAWVMSQVQRGGDKPVRGGMIRDVVESHLARLAVLNSAERPVVDPARPRLAFVKSRKSKSRSGSKRKSAPKG